MENKSTQTINKFIWELISQYVGSQEEPPSATTLSHLMQVYTGFCELHTFGMNVLYANKVQPAPFSNCPKKLFPVLELLIKTLQPVKIYVVQHQHTAIPNYDVLVFVPERPGEKLENLQTYIDLAALSPVPIYCSVFTWGKLIDGFKKAQLYFLLHCTPANLVYDDGTKTSPKIDVLALPNLKEKVESIFMHHFKLAKSFIQGASLYSEQEQFELSTLMLHQCVEFTYRAFLLSFCGSDQKTHRIAHLQSHLKRITPTLNKLLLSDNDEEGKRLFALLEYAYLQARYNADFKIPANDFELLHQKVQAFLQEAQVVFKQYQNILDIAE